ncbi:MAG: replicative DNA helicase, partial [Candidatus Pacebacteria bacterium]|nr:replicative DNA helicase [Candidatus Paceibacterota bacterium]
MPNPQNQDKLPPQNIEAEKSLLGCLMIDPNAIYKVADFLLTKDFYKGQHQKIYDAALELFEKREPIDVLSVSAKLKAKNELDATGGASYLTELVNTVPTASHIANYAKIVQQKRVLRDLISTGFEISEMAQQEDEDVDSLLDRAEKKIFGIAQKTLTQSFSHIKDNLEETWQRIDELSKNQGQLRGISTGFKSLDNILAGFQKSDLIILAARPSIGKSSLAINIAQNVACLHKVPVGIFSLEMSKDQIIDRLIASQANIDSWRLRTGQLSDEGEYNDFERIQSAMAILADSPIYIDDSAGTSVLQMRTMARRLFADKGVGLLIIDYLQLMEHRNPMLSMVQQVTENSRALKGLARELNIPILVVSQLSRAVEQRTPAIPRLSDLRESGGIEQDADVVMFIYREDRYKENTARPGIADIIIAKHRNGPVGKVELYFDEARM